MVTPVRFRKTEGGSSLASVSFCLGSPFLADSQKKNEGWNSISFVRFSVKEWWEAYIFYTFGILGAKCFGLPFPLGIKIAC